MCSAYTVTATSASLGALAKAFDALANVSTVFNIKSAFFNMVLDVSTVTGITYGFDVNLDVVILGKEKSCVASFYFTNLEKTVENVLKKALELIADIFVYFFSEKQ